MTALRRGGARGETEEGFAGLVVSELEKVTYVHATHFGIIVVWRRCVVLMYAFMFPAEDFAALAYGTVTSCSDI